MNPNDETNRPNDDVEEAAAERHFEKLLGGLDRDAAPPDQQALARIGDLTADVFVDRENSENNTEEHPMPASPTPIASAPRPVVSTSHSAGPSRWAWRAVAAAVLCAVGWSIYSVYTSPDAGQSAFADVMQNTARADSLHLVVHRPNQHSEVWTQGKRLRWNVAEGQYLVGDARRLWKVDQKTSRVRLQDSPYYHADWEGIDVLTLLDLGDRTLAVKQSLDKAIPEPVQKDGVEWQVYRANLRPDENDKDPVQIEAFVDSSTGILHSIEAVAVRGGQPQMLGRVVVMAVNEPVDEQLFVVGDSLAEDSRVGKVTDMQGIVSLQPVMHRRWTPVDTSMLLKPGDWIRTDTRGANAVTLRLLDQGDVTVGPGSLIELVNATQLRVTHGELQVAAADGQMIQLLGPEQQQIDVAGKAIFRIDQRTGRLVKVENKPLWLQGYEGTVAHDSIGSLVANIDGRNVPLTVGDHKVTVDIRDQIARTSIEESFVNHTRGRLEGVFYFPLPQDASISGFGMWIGGELIEADVVEKQRAREIYETILRERRDPGLLEWSGGNLFKARVFPIEANSEKRIKITYTQVLPLQRNKFRYSYALRSEMLQQHPLRDLKIDVKVSSLATIKKIHSPTHTTRTDATGNSGHVEFAAQEYTPQRDFEVVVELEGRGSDVVAIPHRRGEDGFFMLQLTPPATGGGWQRDLLPEGEALQVLVLADTSASMDNAARKTQSQVIAALLTALAADDTINIATCDLDCQWLFPNPRPADEAAIDQALDFVAGRESLGWSDLDAAFDAAMEQSGANTHVVYIGDGVVTTSVADPVAFGQRLRQAYREQNRGGAFHAISVGSTYESIALKAIASLGGGSFRQVSGEQSPQIVVKQLLSEIAQPAIRDLKVEFRDVSIAAVYPRQLPNLVAGTQQIILGRYLPEGTDQHGEVIVTGTRDGKPVRFSSTISLKDAEKGNSFIPRLWARMHLDQLLDQGDSAAIRDEIIALSEEFHIITPYTSLLVLETDEDRERFKVKRRFLMRDGERFFAKGRDDVDYELVQKQMRRAGGWRLGLRRSVLRQLSGLGRDPSAIQRLIQGGFTIDQLIPTSRSGGWEFGLQLGGAGGLVPAGSRERKVRSELEGFGETYYASGDQAFTADWDEDGALHDVSRTKSDEGDDRQLEVDNQESPFPAEEPALDRESEEDLELLDSSESMRKEAGAKRAYGRDYYERGREFKRASRLNRGPYHGRWLDFDHRGLYSSRFAGQTRRRGDYYWYGYHVNWLGQLFPNVPAAPPEAKPKETEWPKEAVELAASLLRTETLRGLAGGVEISRRTDSFDVRRDKLAGVRRALEIYSPNRWLVRSGADGGQTLVQWCDAQQRGIYSVAYQLGRIRNSVARDRLVPPLQVGDASLKPLDQSYPTYTVKVERPGPSRALLVLKYQGNQDYELRFEIDTQRNVLLSRVTTNDGKVTTTTTYQDFVEVAGTWWAQQIDTTDADGRRTSLSKQTISELDADTLKQRIDKQLAGLDQVVLLADPAPSVAQAKAAIAGGKGTVGDQIAMMEHFGRTQQWSRVWQHFQAAAELVQGKSGFRWVGYAVEKAGRRNQELQTSLLAAAEQLSRPAAKPWASDTYFLAQYIYGQAGGVLQANEMLGLLDKLRAVYFDQPEHVAGKRVWRTNRATYLESAGRRDEALEAWRTIAADFPHDVNSQTQYAGRLANAGNYAAAYAHLRAAIDSDFVWLPYENNSLHSTYVNLLTRQGRYAQVVQLCSTWMEKDPVDATPYRQYLGALVFSDQEAKANELIEQWLQTARDNETMSPADAARFQAAVYQAIGQGYNFHHNYLDPRWLAPLAETVVNYGGDPAHFYMLGQIMNNHRFQRTDACRRVRARLVQQLLKNIDTLSVLQIQNYVNWIMPNDPAVEKPTWQRIAAAIERRWSGEKRDSDRNQLAQSLNQLLPNKLDAAAWLAFLRKQLDDGPERYHYNYALQLFNAILTLPWDQQLEDEAFSLFNQLADPKLPDRQLAVQVDALHRLASRMVTARYAAQMEGLEHPEELTRTELRSRQQEFRRLAREQFAERLKKEQVQREGALAQWLQVERLHLLIQLKHDLDSVLEECWKHLGDKPRTAAEISDLNDVLDQMLYGRYFVMVANLSARRTTDDAAREKLLAFVERGIADATASTFWKLAKFHLLVALDQPKPLEAALRGWIADAGPAATDGPVADDDPAPERKAPVVAPDPDDKNAPKQTPKPLDVLGQQELELEKSLLANYWRVALGYLLAERGEIADGIALLEKVEAADELMASDYRTLANWYLVVDRREDHERALVDIYKKTEEHRLRRFLSNRLNPWQRTDGNLPTELDKNVLLVFRALFEKSTYPQNYLWQLRGFYTASRDFRLLAVLADAMVGQTAVKIYPFLNGMHSVLEEIRDEATADSIVEYLPDVRNRARTPVDRRALDLLEMQVERRAAEVLNQPGPHVEAAVAAMRRAFEREWSAGEPRLMAELLAGLGRISQQPLADEQLRELRLLHSSAERGSLDRLHIAHHGSRAMWYYNQYEPAINQLGAALSEYQQAIDGPLPAHVNSIVSNYVSYLKQKDRYAEAETYLLGQLERKNNQQQVYWYTLQLYQIYHDALDDNGAVSIGRGSDLYRALETKIITDLAITDHNHRYNLFQLICRVYRTAQRRKVPRVAADLHKFAFAEAPPHLQRQTNNYASIVGTIADTVHDLIGPRDGLAFLVDRIENEPSWLRYQRQDGWSQHAGRLGQWRFELKQPLGDIEPRLLAIVLDALRRDLRQQRQRNRSMYTRHNNRFWSAKQHEFERVTENVHSETKSSGAAVVYIAQYLYHGLDRHDRAIEMMWEAQRKNRLDESGQSQLVYFLHDQKRFAESVSLLYELVDLRPDTIRYRAQLMHALFRTDRDDELLDVLAQTDEHFHGERRWTEGNMAALAASCLQNQLFKQSVAYYEELIPLHQRTHTRRGIGGGTLSGYYASQALAYAGLKDTPRAVEAASGAIISWGPRHHNRSSAIESLKQVLRNAPDLAAYVKQLNRETEESGLDKPIVRKALGQILLERKQIKDAIVQLDLALELQPNDAETHQALITCYEKLGDRQGVVDRILAAVQLRRRDIQLYKDLADRLRGNPSRAERAATSIVEVLPNETESHTMLAEMRQQQDRWDDAIIHWQRVAELRALEPTGLLKVAEAQIHEGHWDDARESLTKLTARSWPQRFGNVHDEARKLWQQVDRNR